MAALLGNLLGTVDGLLGGLTGSLSGDASANAGASASTTADLSHTLDLGAVIETVLPTLERADHALGLPTLAAHFGLVCLGNDRLFQYDGKVGFRNIGAVTCLHLVFNHESTRFCILGKD